MAELGGNPIKKFTLAEWIKHPTTILLIGVTFVSGTIGSILIYSMNTQIEYLKERIVKLETQLDQYTNTILFQEVKEKGLKDELVKKEIVIDSLKGGGQ